MKPINTKTIFYKTQEELDSIRKSSLLVSKTLATLAELIKPGISPLYLDKIAEEFIRDNNAYPSFLGYRKFPNSLCVSINEAVVHGIPTNYELKDSDIISIDCGVYFESFHGDSAYTFALIGADEKKQKLLSVTKQSLLKGIENATIGKRIGDISFAIQQVAESNGFSVVRELVGHGVGRELHEGPEVPNFGKRGQGIKLIEGLVLAIEPMINMGKRDIILSEDGWTLSSKDGKPSAHFEHTIAISKEKAMILSDFNIIEQVIRKNNNLMLIE